MDRDEELRRRRGEHTRSYSQDKPIGSGENAQAILRGIKQWLPDLLASPGDIADLATAAAKRVARGQKQTTPVPTNYGGQIRGALTKVQPRAQTEVTEIPEPSWFEKGTRMLNPLFLNPRRAASPLSALAALSGAPGAELSIVKPKGGNWYTVKNTQLNTILDSLRKNGKGPSVEAFNRWLEGPLAKYIKNELATENDTVRKLLNSDTPISHFNIAELINRATNPYISTTAIANRQKAGFEGRMPDVPMTDAAKAWNELADASVAPKPARQLYEQLKAINEKHPMAADWVKNLPENSPIYVPSLSFTHDLGIKHFTDELWNASRKNSDLPSALRIKPEDLQQYGIEKAIRRVHDINKYREGLKEAGNVAMLQGPGVKTIREYSENNPKGLRWVELGGEDVAGLERQLKYEGDTMGHCVGGYCDDVLSGNTKIFSLRDAKGEPHVTIEMLPPADQKLVSKAKEAERVFTEETGLPFDPVENDDFMEWALSDGYERYGDVLATNISPGYSIKQIKGKQNLAPKEDYLPFIKDFLANPYHGSTWGEDIGDLDTLGLSPEDLAKIPRGYAQGGLVGKQDFNGVVGYILD